MDDRLANFNVYSPCLEDNAETKDYSSNHQHIPKYVHKASGDQYTLPMKGKRLKPKPYDDVHNRTTHPYYQKDDIQRDRYQYDDVMPNYSQKSHYEEIDEPGYNAYSDKCSKHNLENKTSNIYSEIDDYRSQVYYNEERAPHDYNYRNKQEDRSVSSGSHHYEYIDDLPLPSDRTQFQGNDVCGHNLWPEHDPHNRDYFSTRISRRRKNKRFKNSVTTKELRNYGTGTLRFRSPELLDALRNIEDGECEEYVDYQWQPMTTEEALEHIHALPQLTAPLHEKRRRLYELSEKIPENHHTTVKQSWFSIKQSLKKFNSNIKIKGPLTILKKDIEGRLGASVVAVYNLMEDLLILNFLMTIVMLGSIVIPSSLGIDDDADLMYGWNEVENNSYFSIDHSSTSQVYKSSLEYKNSIKNTTSSQSLIHRFEDILLGTGILERTLLFSGYYPVIASKNNYRLSLVFVTTMMVLYTCSLIYVCTRFAHWCRTVIGGFSPGVVYSSILFSNWDYSLSSEKAVRIAKTLIKNEFICAMDDEEFTKKHDHLSKKEYRILILKRVGLNILISLIIAGSWVGVYFAVTESSNKEDPTFFLEYAPTLTITAIDFFIPFIIHYFTYIEQYSSRTELFVVLFRCVFIRLTSLVVLVVTQLTANPNCWETKYAQQMYSLIIFGMLTEFGKTFMLNVLRKYLTRFKSIKKYVAVYFIVSDHVLEIIYLQTVCWLGTVYSPLLPLIVFIYLCLLFIFKTFTIYFTCSPPSRVFRSSKSSSVFTIVLVISFTISLIPACLYLGFLTPSNGCTPFRGLGHTWEAITYYIIQDSNAFVRDVMFYMDNTIVYLVILLILLLLLFYYTCELQLNNKKIKILHKKVNTVEKDKKYINMMYDSYLKQ